MKCDDIRIKLPVSVLVGDRWIDGQIGNYNLRHTYRKEDWTGYAGVQFHASHEDDDGIVIRVPAAMIPTHIRERTP